MPRGGKRTGAGRLYSLTEIETLEVGAECEQRWLALVRENVEKVQAERYARSDYIEQISALNCIPVADRPAFLNSAAFELHKEDVEFARREMSDMDPMIEDVAPRVIIFVGKRPKNARPQIIAAVAGWASARFGRTVTCRTVETAWKKTRRLIAEVNSYNETPV